MKTKITILLITFSVLSFSQNDVIKLKEGNPIIAEVTLITDYKYYFKKDGITDSIDKSKTTNFIFSGDQDRFNRINRSSINDVNFDLSEDPLINGVKISDINSKYITITGTQIFLKNKIAIEVDFGQDAGTFNFNASKTVIKDKNGSIKTFNSITESLNFFSKYNYKLVQAYSLPKKQNNMSVSFHYIMEKQ